jgi:hypothetical protein
MIERCNHCWLADLRVFAAERGGEVVLEDAKYRCAYLENGRFVVEHPALCVPLTFDIWDAARELLAALPAGFDVWVQYHGKPEKIWSGWLDQLPEDCRCAKLSST